MDRRFTGTDRMTSPHDALIEQVSIRQALLEPSYRRFFRGLPLRAASEADQYLDSVVGLLDRAETFLWSAEMNTVLIDAVQDYPEQGENVWRQDLLLSPYMYWAYETDLVIPPSSPLKKKVPWAKYVVSTLHGTDQKALFTYAFYMHEDLRIVPVLHHYVRIGAPVTGLAERQMYAGYQFLNSKYIGTVKHRSNRADRRRWERATGNAEPPLASVVVLRRRDDRQGDSPEGRDVDWSYRWMVRGHWHPYWCGAGEDRRLENRWLAPYVKGPEDKPFKRPARQLFAVVH